MVELIHSFLCFVRGKRHVITMRVKLCKARADEHKEHADTAFCTATIHNLETLALVLGPHNILFFS